MGLNLSKQFLPIFLLILLILVWTSVWSLFKIAIEAIPPLSFRVIIGIPAFFVLLFLGFKKGKDINNILNLIIGKTNYNLHLIEDDTFFDQEITKEIGYLLDKHGKNYKIASLEQFKKNKNPSILLGSLYLIGEYKKREL